MWTSADTYEIRADAKRFENWEANYAAKLGLGIAVDYALDLGVDRTWPYVQHLADTLRRELEATGRVQVHDKAVGSGIVTFTVDGLDAEDIQAALAGSSVNTSISLPEDTRWDASGRPLPPLVRASVHYYNTTGEIARSTPSQRRENRPPLEIAARAIAAAMRFVLRRSARRSARQPPPRCTTDPSPVRPHGNGAGNRARARTARRRRHHRRALRRPSRRPPRRLFPDQREPAPSAHRPVDPRWRLRRWIQGRTGRVHADDRRRRLHRGGRALSASPEERYPTPLRQVMANAGPRPGRPRPPSSATRFVLAGDSAGAHHGDHRDRPRLRDVGVTATIEPAHARCRAVLRHLRPVTDRRSVAVQGPVQRCVVGVLGRPPRT